MARLVSVSGGWGPATPPVRIVTKGTRAECRQALADLIRAYRREGALVARCGGFGRCSVAVEVERVTRSVQGFVEVWTPWVNLYLYEGV